MSALDTIVTTAPVRLNIAATPIDYLEALRTQEARAESVRLGEHPGEVFLLEHPPVYTAGRRTEEHELPRDDTPIHWINRGGKVTWHGPGQLVGYPVIRLREPHAVVDFVRALERMIIRALSTFAISAHVVDGRAGVWVPTATGDEKIAQIGIHVSAGIVTHGFAVNCSNDLAPFGAFIPCGISDAGVTSISQVLGKTVTPQMFTRSLIPELTELVEEVAK